MGEPFDRPVVQVGVRDLDVRGEPLRIDRIAVVLRRDLDAARAEVLDGLVPASVAELELERLRAHRDPEDLVPEADAEDRNAPDEVANDLDGVARSLRVAGSVREEDAVGPECQRLGGGEGGRNDGHARARIAQAAQDVLFGAVVVGDDVRLRARPIAARGRSRSRRRGSGRGRRAGR